MLGWDDLAWWPFDGLDINSEAYQDKHVAVEIYPSALRPAGVIQSDDNDAVHSCLYARDADRSNQLQTVLSLDQVQPQYGADILSEGWIVGMNPNRYFS